MYEQAIEYFERAALVQPGEAKWQLMVTSCYRRLGDYNKAFELYQVIHEKHPENAEALQYLEVLCRDLNRPHDEYTRKLEKLRRSQPQQQATMQGGITRAGPGPTGGGGGAAHVQRGKLRVDRPDRNTQQAAIQEEKSEAVALEENSSSRSPMLAPQARAGAQARPAQASKPKPDDDDDFGDTDVSNLLAF
jgi:intraflagellar transport protein 88